MATEQTDSFEINVGGQEAKQSQHVIELQDIPAGVDSLFELEYKGNGRDNGHFIDMLRLYADGC